MLGAARFAQAGVPREPSVLEMAPMLAEIVVVPILELPGRMVSPGANTQSHAFFDTTNDCGKCHTKGHNEKVENALCTAAGCHDSDIGCRTVTYRSLLACRCRSSGP